MKVLAKIFILLSGCAIFLLQCPSSEHGLGFLQRVRNNSEYPIDFSQEKTLLDFLPDGTVIRIKSLKKEYGVNGRYYAARKIVGAYRLEADTINPEDPATYFVVKRFVARDFSEYMGLYSDSAEGQFMKTDDSRAVTFSMPDVMDDTNAPGHWTIVDSTGAEKGGIDQRKFLDPHFASTVFNNCYIKSRVSGFMQSRGTPQNYPGLTKVVLGKSVNSVLAGAESSTKEDPKETLIKQPSLTLPEETRGSSGNNGTTNKPKESPVALGEIKQLSADKSISMCYIDTSNIIVIKQDGSPIKMKDDGSSELLNQGLNGASLSSIAGGNDGTIWASDQNNNLLEFDSEKSSWKNVTNMPAASSISKIALNNSSNIWALSGDGSLFQRVKIDDSFAWKTPTNQIGSGNIKDISVASDGTILVISSDSKIYKGTSNNGEYAFSVFCSPKDLFSIPPLSVACGASSFIAFLTPMNEIYVLVDGKSGNTKDSWKKLCQNDQKTPLKFRSIAAYKNKSIIGVVSNSGKPDDNTLTLVSNITTV